MKLILFRHGLAAEREDFIARKLEDALRPLTEKGEQKSRKVALHLQSDTPEVHLLVCSPLLRAQQTAAVVGKVIVAHRFIESAELMPEAPPQAFASWLKTHASLVSSVLVVGHEPHLSTFASWLLAGREESFLKLKKSGVVILEVPSFDQLGPNTGRLKALINPKMI